MTAPRANPAAVRRSSSSSYQRPAASDEIGLLVGILIGLGLATGFAAAALHDSTGRPVVHPQERVNPNDAPVASLVRLPGLGLTRARAIVAHRDRIRAQAGQPPAFTTPDDLQQIRGIGPAIVDGLRPWLQLDTPQSTSNRLR